MSKLEHLFKVESGFAKESKRRERQINAAGVAPGDIRMRHRKGHRGGVLLTELESVGGEARFGRRRSTRHAREGVY